jgi:hypothetical protein
MSEKSYTYVFNSYDRISGTINNAVYNANLTGLLPAEHQFYKLSFFMITDTAFYTDTYNTGTGEVTYAPQTVFITWNQYANTFHRESDNSPSPILGYALRSTVQPNNVTTSCIRYFTTSGVNNPDLTILRPTTDLIQLSFLTGIRNPVLLVSTNPDGSVYNADMSNYSLTMKFTPVTK